MPNAPHKPPKPAKPAKPSKPVYHPTHVVAPVPDPAAVYVPQPQPHGGSVGRLVQLVSNPELVKGVWAMVRGQYPAFPTIACAATLSTFLAQAGFPQSFGTWAQTEINEALTEGWAKIPVGHPVRAGDVFVCADLNQNGATDHVGVVYSPAADPNFFWAIDNRTDKCVDGKPYMRNVGPGPFTRISYFIRYTG